MWSNLVEIWKMKNWIILEILAFFEKFQGWETSCHLDLSFAHIFDVHKICLHEIAHFFNFQGKIAIFGFTRIFSQCTLIFKKIHQIRTAAIISVRLRYFSSKTLQGGGREWDLKTLGAKFDHKIGHLIQPERATFLFLNIVHNRASYVCEGLNVIRGRDQFNYDWLTDLHITRCK